MILGCIPLLALAVVLLATGVVGPYFLLFAVACTVMMAVMMRGMHGMNGMHGENEAKPKYGDQKAPGGLRHGHSRAARR